MTEWRYLKRWFSFVYCPMQAEAAAERERPAEKAVAARCRAGELAITQQSEYPLRHRDLWSLVQAEAAAEQERRAEEQWNHEAGQLAVAPGNSIHAYSSQLYAHFAQAEAAAERERRADERRNCEAKELAIALEMSKKEAARQEAARREGRYGNL